jgi:hypothetical protein
MLELGSSGSVRGASSNGRPYREPGPITALVERPCGRAGSARKRTLPEGAGCAKIGHPMTERQVSSHMAHCRPVKRHYAPITPGLRTFEDNRAALGRIQSGRRLILSATLPLAHSRAYEDAAPRRGRRRRRPSTSGRILAGRPFAPSRVSTGEVARREVPHPSKTAPHPHRRRTS